MKGNEKKSGTASLSSWSTVGREGEVVEINFTSEFSNFDDYDMVVEKENPTEADIRLGTTKTILHIPAIWHFVVGEDTTDEKGNVVHHLRGAETAAEVSASGVYTMPTLTSATGQLNYGEAAKVATTRKTMLFRLAKSKRGKLFPKFEA